MPYIKKDIREMICENGKINMSNIKSAGDLNYAVTEMIIFYFNSAFKRNYQAINDIAGALDGAKVEFQRRVAAPYEDAKIEENGDLRLYNILDPKN